MIAHRTAEILWQIGAVKFSPEPFQFASGIKSPIYINCRAPIFHPQYLQELMAMAVTKIKPIKKDITLLAGGETAGIPYAMYLAKELFLPMIYVRKKPKGYGMNASIEGGNSDDFKKFYQGQKPTCLLVEDLATNGGSKVNFINGLQQAGFLCQHGFVIFYYGIFPTVAGLENFTLHHLTTASDVFQIAKQKNLYDNETLKSVEAFLQNPLLWSKQHGGVDSF